jgi:ComF family protein
MRGFQGIVCQQCGYAFASQNIATPHPLCGSCRRGLYAFDFARAYATFEDPLKEIIHHFKYQSRRSLAHPLALRLAAVYRENASAFDVNLVIAIPLHRSREAERGFNQATELARHFCRETSLPLLERVLQRIRATQIQAGLSRRERRINLKGAFQVTQPEKLSGKKILVIDDVFTTGATLNECAKILKHHGAARVCLLTLARVIR